MSFYSVFKDVTNNISSQSNVCAILLIGKTGSSTESNFEKLNDVDLLIVYDQNVPFERQVEDIDNVPFDISYISIYDLITQIEAKSPLWINMIVGSKIFYTKNELIFGIVDRVKDIYYSGTAKLRKDEVELIRFNLTQKYNDIAKRLGDTTLSNYLMIKLFDTVIENYYRINCIWYPRTKYLFENLEARDELLWELSEKFIFECVSETKIILLKKLLVHVLEPFGGLLNTWAKGPYEITL